MSKSSSSTGSFANGFGDDFGILGPGGLRPSEFRSRVKEFQGKLDDAKKEGNLPKAAELHEWLAGMLVVTEEKDKGLRHADEAIRLYQDLGEARLELRALLLKSRLLRIVGKNREAQGLILKAQALMGGGKDPLAKLELGLDLSASYRAQADFGRAARQCSELEALLPSPKGLGEAKEKERWARLYPQFWQEVAMVKQGLGAFEEAAHAFEQIALWYEGLGEEGDALSARLAKAPFLEWAGQVVEANRLWTQLAKDARRLKVPRVEAQSYLALASFAASKKIDGEAIEWASWARTLALKNVFPDLYFEATVTLLEVYDRQGLRDKGFDLYCRAKQLLTKSMGAERSAAFTTPYEEALKKKWGSDTFQALEKAWLKENASVIF